MQQFKSEAQEAAFNAVMRLKTAEREHWGTVVVLRGDAYTAALAKHLAEFKFPRESAWDAYAVTYLGGVGQTKKSPSRKLWEARQAKVKQG